MKQRILERIAKFFIESSDFNGIPLSAIIDEVGDEEKAKYIVQSLVEEGAINCSFVTLSLNPHIKRIPDLTVKDQQKFLKSEAAKGICLYPSADVVKANLDVSKYDDRPYSQKLILGKSQLDFEAFDLAVLERYFRDPRYHTEFSDYRGQISIGSKAYQSKDFPERDKVLLESFGLGYDEDRNRVAIAFLRYLCRMTPEHQQFWNSYTWPRPAKMCREYYINSIEGNFAEYGSFQKAITYEIRAINQILESIKYSHLFRDDFVGKIPLEISLFTRPTLRNYNEFVSTLDKLLSENIDKKFFKGRIPLEFEEERKDGKIKVVEKGSLLLLEEWLRKDISWKDEDEAISIIVGPLREVRHLRQKPAHKHEEDKRDPKIDEKRNRLLKDVCSGLMNLRLILARHPKACEPDIPKFLRDGKVTYF